MAEPVDKDPIYWVLCIDDDPFLRLGLQNALDQTKDIELSAASTKAEGMKLFVEMWNGSSKEESRKPSLVLLDQDLQDGDKGTDLLNDIVEFCGGTPQDAAKVCRCIDDAEPVVQSDAEPSGFTGCVSISVDKTNEWCAKACSTDSLTGLPGARRSPRMD